MERKDSDFEKPRLQNVSILAPSNGEFQMVVARSLAKQGIQTSFNREFDPAKKNRSNNNDWPNGALSQADTIYLR